MRTELTCIRWLNFTNENIEQKKPDYPPPKKKDALEDFIYIKFKIRRVPLGAWLKELMITQGCLSCENQSSYPVSICALLCMYIILQ